MGDIYLNLNPAVPQISGQSDKSKINLRYVVIEPYVSIHIFWNPKDSELNYEVEEPLLNDSEKVFLEKLEKSIREIVNIEFASGGDKDQLVSYLDKTTRIVISELGLKIEQESYNKLFYFLYRNFIGLNEIESLMHDYFIEDIECNGVDEPIYIIHRVFRNIKTNVKFNSIDKLANFVEKLAQKSGRYISYASPLLDGSLPDGSRINATYTKDVTSKGPTFTIRKFTKVPWTPVQLIGLKTLSPEMLAYFWILLQYKSNILITGGTASGKTTLLNAISFFIPPEARVVSIEDTRELNIPRQNWLPSVARTGVHVGDVGEVDMFSLLKNSFRQSPDYVIVGEVRGKEANVLFQGMASGHASISTMHADSINTVIKRLQTPPISLDPSLVSILDVVAIMTHALSEGKETRKLREIVEVVDVKSDGTAYTNTPFVWDPAKDNFYSGKTIKIFDKIEKRYGISRQNLLKELILRAKLLYTLFKKNITDYNEVQKIVNEYYKNPADTLRQFGVM